MCGIIITKNKNKLDSIKHRGIEFSSVEKDGWINGHYRLPIQTLIDDEWSQPIELTGEWELLLYNGEIFNYDKEKYGNDTEYLKDIFSKKQLFDLIAEINTWDGFWSIVLIGKDRTLCFTDPLGKKQLYYNDAGEISSEVKGLSNTNIIDQLFISDIHKWGYNTDDRTLYNDVKRIIPNRFYFFSGKDRNWGLEVIPQNYFHWNFNIPSKSFYELLEESVNSRLISKKYKISTLFSGGLDSTIILYFLIKYGLDFDIWSIANGTDGGFVQIIQDLWNLKINYLNPNIEKISIKNKIYDINDSPIDLGSVIPQYFLFKDITNKIVLTGDGSDELFGGYSRIEEYDSQKSDIFKELTFYHLIRLDRMSMNFTIECRNPFLSHDIIKKALVLPYKERINKKILKKEFKGYIPDFIINRKKEPLKIKAIHRDGKEYRHKVIEEYLKLKDK